MTKRKDAHALMLGRLRRLARKYDTAVARLAVVEDERSQAYADARKLDPPMTFREIAGAFGITEAAVIQKIRRHEAGADSRPREMASAS